jgi:outer membrane protein
MKLKFKLLAAAALLVSSQSFAQPIQSPIIGGDLGFYINNQNIDGWIETKGDGKVDLQDDLGLDNKGSYFANLRVRHNLPIPYLPEFYVQYNRVKHSAGATLGRSITYAGETFDKGENINSTIKLDHWDFILPFRVLKNDKVDLRMGLDIRYINYDTQITSDNEVAIKTKDIYVPLFYLGVDVDISPEIKLLFEEKFITYSGNNFSDLNLELRYIPPLLTALKPFVSVGYRYEVINMDDMSGINSAITLNQPYIGAGITF